MTETGNRAIQTTVPFTDKETATKFPGKFSEKTRSFHEKERGSPGDIGEFTVNESAIGGGPGKGGEAIGEPPVS
jgi:hypothetical protein